MGLKVRFHAAPEAGFCTGCGSVRGRLLDIRLELPPIVRSAELPEGLDTSADVICPSPFCPLSHAPGQPLMPGVDPSYLYRGRALLFFPDPEATSAKQASEGESAGEVGVVRAVPYDHVHDETARRKGLIVLRDVRWPADRKHFGELLDHHIHHERAPHVSPLNDGWDSKHGLPVL